MTGRRCLPLTVGVLIVGFAAAGPAVAIADEPDPLIGTWILNRSRSTYVTGPPPKSIVRTFDYTRDGLILVTLATVNAQGVATSNHWYLSLDGREYPEYSRAGGATPILWISMKAVDARIKELTGRRMEGGLLTVVDLMRFEVAADGRTMTITYTDAKTGQRGNVVAYDKQ